MKGEKESKENLLYLEDLGDVEQGISNTAQQANNGIEGSEQTCQRDLLDAESNTEYEYGCIRRRATR